MPRIVLKQKSGRGINFPMCDKACSRRRSGARFRTYIVSGLWIISSWNGAATEIGPKWLLATLLSYPASIAAINFVVPDFDGKLLSRAIGITVLLVVGTSYWAGIGAGLAWINYHRKKSMLPPFD